LGKEKDTYRALRDAPWRGEKKEGQRPSSHSDGEKGKRSSILPLSIAAIRTREKETFPYWGGGKRLSLALRATYRGEGISLLEREVYPFQKMRRAISTRRNRLRLSARKVFPHKITDHVLSSFEGPRGSVHEHLTNGGQEVSPSCPRVSKKGEAESHSSVEVSTLLCVGGEGHKASLSEEGKKEREAISHPFVLPGRPN